MEKTWIVRDIGSLLWYMPIANQLIHNLDSDYPMIHTNDTISYATSLIRGFYDVFKNRRNRNQEFNENPLSYVIKVEKKLK